MNYFLYKAYKESLKESENKQLTFLKEELEDCDVLLDTILESVYEDSKTLSLLLDSLKASGFQNDGLKQRAKSIVRDILIVSRDYFELSDKKEKVTKKIEDLNSKISFTGNSVNNSFMGTSNGSLSKRPNSRFPKRI